MQEYMDDADETLSLSNLPIAGSQQLSKANQSSSSPSSSSFDQDFLGFFSEEWSRNIISSHTAPENIVFCGKMVASRRPITGDKKPESKSQTSPLFRSRSDSFRYLRLKNVSRPSTSRSKSLTERNRLASSPSKSRWQAFMFGFGSGKFPTKMDMSKIKSRQLRLQSTRTGATEEESGGRRSGKKGWWRLVDVLGCGGGYGGDAMVII